MLAIPSWLTTLLESWWDIRIAHAPSLRHWHPLRRAVSERRWRWDMWGQEFDSETGCLRWDVDLASACKISPNLGWLRITDQPISVKQVRIRCGNCRAWNWIVGVGGANPRKTEHWLPRLEMLIRKSKENSYRHLVKPMCSIMFNPFAKGVIPAKRP